MIFHLCPPFAFYSDVGKQEKGDSHPAHIIFLRHITPPTRTSLSYPTAAQRHITEGGKFQQQISYSQFHFSI